MSSGKELEGLMSTLRSHFASGGGPVMAGGDMDCSSKCIVGERAGHLLVVVMPLCLARLMMLIE
jgi:hypothetical protein